MPNRNTITKLLAFTIGVVFFMLPTIGWAESPQQNKSLKVDEAESARQTKFQLAGWIEIHDTDFLNFREKIKSHYKKGEVVSKKLMKLSMFGNSETFQKSFNVGNAGAKMEIIQGDVYANSEHETYFKIDLYKNNKLVSSRKNENARVIGLEELKYKDIIYYQVDGWTDEGRCCSTVQFVKYNGKDLKS